MVKGTRLAVNSVEGSTQHLNNEAKTIGLFNQQHEDRWNERHLYHGVSKRVQGLRANIPAGSLNGWIRNNLPHLPEVITGILSSCQSGHRRNTYDRNGCFHDDSFHYRPYRRSSYTGTCMEYVRRSFRSTQWESFRVSNKSCDRRRVRWGRPNAPRNRYTYPNGENRMINGKTNLVRRNVERNFPAF